jgi:CheY-like chemotaxis protein
MAQVGLLEDNEQIAKFCTTLLHFAGHQVTVYDTSLKCLQALFTDGRTRSTYSSSQVPSKKSSLPVEVLILDLALPDINGIEVLHCLTSHPHTQRLPLILCTAATDIDIIKALRIAPHAGIVEKPFKLDTLISAISTALESSIRQVK